MLKKSETGRQGWVQIVPVALILLVCSELAWGLDFQKEIHRQQQDSAQILSTLGRGKAVNGMTSAKTHKEVRLKLVRKKR